MSSDTSAPATDTNGDVVFGYPEMPMLDAGMSGMPKGVGAKATLNGDSSTRPIASRMAASGRGASGQAVGPPLPKRPKGRLFIGVVILALLAFGVSTIYDQTIRYVAYGEVTAKRIQIAAPWPGVVDAVFKRDGDVVQPGDLIAKVESLELAQQIEAIDDSLRVERAQLASDFETLRWEAEKIKDSRRLSQSEFYDKYSELLWQQSRLSDLRNQEKRLRPLVEEGAASRERIQTISYQLAGQEKRVEQLKQAVTSLRDRGDHTVELSLEDRVRPTLVRIENLQAESDRVRARRQQGEVRAKMRGRILRMNRFVGEYADQTEPIAEMVVDFSQTLVLYLPQTMAVDFPEGASLGVYVPSMDRNIRCKVRRADLSMRTAPPSLARYYASDQALLPLHLEINDEFMRDATLPIGTEIRLSRGNQSTWIDTARDAWHRWTTGSTPTQKSSITATPADATSPSVTTPNATFDDTPNIPSTTHVDPHVHEA